MRIEDVYTAVQFDEAFRWSVDHKDYMNMALVLRSWGFKHSLEHAHALVTYAERVTNT